VATTQPVVLLYASTLRTGADYEQALRESGYEVVRAATTRSVERCLRDSAVELVLLDCATSDAERATRVINSIGRSMPRIWVSSSSDAPRRSGHLGVDVLLIDPDDVVAVMASVARFLTPRAPVERPHRFMADGTNPPRGRPRGTGPVGARAEIKDRDPSASWDDPTSDWKLRGKPGDD
jgi:DNA-binding NtrC family response regulator